MSLFDEINSIDDVQRLLFDEGVREGETLDYKRLQTWEQETSASTVAKHASAFANGAGGLLVYGVATPKEGDYTLPARIDGVNPALIPKVHRAITRGVRHPIPGIRSKSLPSPDNPQVHLVEIPRSPLAPHQHVSSHSYFLRVGDDSVPMSHELVELYFGRRLGPTLELRCESPLRVEGDTGGVAPSYDTTLSLANLGAGVGRDVMLVVDTDPENVAAMEDVRPANHSRVSALSDRRQHHVWRVHGASLVVHPTDVVLIAYLRFRAATHLSFDRLEVARVRVYADRMAPREWSLRIARWMPGLVLELAAEPVLEGVESTEGQ